MKYVNLDNCSVSEQANLDVSNIQQVDGNISSLSSVNNSSTVFNDLQDSSSLTKDGFDSNPNRIKVIVNNRAPTFRENETRIPVLKRIKRNTKLLEATKLPSVMNLNPRSIYNKIDEFLLLVEQYGSDLIFLSETWDRITQPLQSLIQLENYEVITSVNPRSFKGGQPALVINEEKFHIKHLNPDPITVPEGVEAVWALLTPKLGSNKSAIKHIAAIYYI